MMPRYYKGAASHCFYTDNWHFYFFWEQKCHATGNQEGIQTGITIKHRIKKGRPELWRHYQFRKMIYGAIATGGRIYHYELSTHLSEHFKRNRILKTKRYIRLKVCK